MIFAVGDIVEVVDDLIKGIIVAVEGTTITIQTEDDFLLKFEVSELVKVASYEISKELSNQKIYAATLEKEAAKPRKKKLPVSKKERVEMLMEVDLHIEKLTKSLRGLTNHDILTLQLDTAKRQLEFAIRKRIPKAVFIHGVGEGVLKMELEYLFGRYPNIKYYDANYQKYGLGATEVYIMQNPK